MAKVTITFEDQPNGDLSCAVNIEPPCIDGDQMTLALATAQALLDSLRDPDVKAYVHEMKSKFVQ